jgi:hypothetical protein
MGRTSSAFAADNEAPSTPSPSPAECNGRLRAALPNVAALSLARLEPVRAAGGYTITPWIARLEVVVTFAPNATSARPRSIRRPAARNWSVIGWWTTSATSARCRPASTPSLMRCQCSASGTSIRRARRTGCGRRWRIHTRASAVAAWSAAKCGGSLTAVKIYPDCGAARLHPGYVSDFAIASEPLSAIMMVAGWILGDGITGITEASTTRRPSMPRTRSSESTTALSFSPIRQVPQG